MTKQELESVRVRRESDYLFVIREYLVEHGNPKVEKTFQEMVCKSVSEYFQTDFNLEVVIPIGHSSKNHKFDCVSDDKKRVQVVEVDEQGRINVVRG